MATYTYLLAISRLPLAIAVAIQFSATAWIALSQAIWRKRFPPWPVMIAILFAIGGVILVTDVWRQSFNGLDTLGILYAILTTLAYIGYMLIGQRVGRMLPALTSTAYGALVASVILFLLQPPWSIPLSTWQPQHVLLILLVGIIGMALPFSLMLAALRRIDSTRASTVSTLELVTASVIGYFWLNQHLTIWQIVGCTLVPIGVIILQYEQQGNQYTERS
jgi:inner membrane transporter RhtA